MQLDYITIRVRIADDGMTARFVLTPVDGAEGELTVGHLEAALAEAGVTNGVNRSCLADIANDWNGNPREFETKPAAVGTPPKPGKEGALRVAVKHLTSFADIKAALGRKRFWEVAALSHKFQRVDHGIVIARREAGVPGVSGCDVTGAEVKPEGDADELGAGIVEKHNVFIAGNTYTAAKTGIVFIDGDGEPHVMPLDFDGVVEIRMLSSMMSAELVAQPAGEGGVMPSGEYVRNLIKSNRIVYGVDEELLEETLARFALGEIDSKEVIVIATGLPAVKGDDGSVEFCFNVESPPTPTINEDGSADYKNIDIVTSVKKGTILARLLPPTKGTPGKDLTGRLLPAIDGAPAILPVGTNTAVPREDQTVLVAVTDGIVRYDGTSVNVTEGYVIPGNVDYSTGNVTYENSIYVEGDIKSGFEVHCGGDLQVNSIIEDGKITTGGNVLCRYGFVGSGKGVIEATGDVSLGYAKNQTIIAHGDINIAKEAINCEITSRKSIHVYGHSLSVAGGTLSAGESIVVKTVGNISGIKTILHITMSPEILEELARIEDDIRKNRDDMNTLAQKLNTLPPAKRLDKPLVEKFNNAITTLKQKNVSLENRARTINTTMNTFDGAFIRVDRCAYPGTTFKFGERVMTLKDMLAGGKTLRMVDGEIKIM